MTVLLMLPTATIIILGCVFYSNISFEGMNRVMVPVGASLLLMTNIFIFTVFDRFVEKFRRSEEDGPAIPEKQGGDCQSAVYE